MCQARAAVFVLVPFGSVQSRIFCCICFFYCFVFCHLDQMTMLECARVWLRERKLNCCIFRFPVIVMTVHICKMQASWWQHSSRARILVCACKSHFFNVI